MGKVRKLEQKCTFKGTSVPVDLKEGEIITEDPGKKSHKIRLR